MNKKLMPEHFRYKLHCLDCNGGIEADGHNSMSCIDIYLSGHIEAFNHKRYTLEIS